ncbi:MAG: hypothetical protein ACTS5I_03945, partial [Rhodanobacter sp.]
FLVIMLASVELGIKAFIQADLDRVLTEVATNLSVSESDAENSRDYVNAQICAMAGPLIDCHELSIGAKVVSGRLFDYRNQSLSEQWNVGCAADVVIVELTYSYFDIILPFAIADIVEVNGIKRYRSRAVLRREPILAGSHACAAR